jgi:hypothetical protein
MFRVAGSAVYRKPRRRPHSPLHSYGHMMGISRCCLSIGCTLTRELALHRMTLFAQQDPSARDNTGRVQASKGRLHRQSVAAAVVFWYGQPIQTSKLGSFLATAHYKIRKFRIGLHGLIELSEHTERHVQSNLHRQFAQRF